MTIVFKVSDNVKDKMIKYYEDLKRDKTPPYAIFQAMESDTIITLYESGKVMFQGISADIDANIWIDLEKRLNNRTIIIENGKEKKETKKDDINYNFDKYNTIGSDEVGTGDYFGPIVVAATYVNKENVSFLKDLKVNDSKKITDETIKKIAPQIMNAIPYSAFILKNEEYNKLNHETINLNKIKAILHNKVLLNLTTSINDYDKVVVDQFTPPKSYFNYLSDTPNKVTNITFTPKAESKCLSVACASIISRYIFLNEMDKLSKKYNIEIPKGAGDTVDAVAQNIKDNYGFETLKDLVKLNFKNTNKLK